ncbi:uncharacterized protein [Arachis hypogaea]|uniref:uncharacterized protein n=1 Tax=Arachis hypogaea TaxID=3818 RepID=UPI000DEC17DA
MPRKEKGKANPSAPPPTRLSTQSDTFVNETAQEQYKKLENKAFHYERKLNVPDKYAKLIHNRLNFCQWKFIELDPVEINEHQVKEFYENLLKRETTTVFLRGVTLDTSDHALETLLQIPHISPANDAYPKIVKDLTSGKLSLDIVLKKIGLPEARWEYSSSENTVPLSIACSDLTLEARIWQQIIADYILLSTHATHIRVRVAVLLWVFWRGRGSLFFPLSETRCGR